MKNSFKQNFQFSKRNFQKKIKNIFKKKIYKKSLNLKKYFILFIYLFK